MKYNYLQSAPNNSEIIINVDLWLIILMCLFITFIVFSIVRWLVRKKIVESTFHDHAIFLVRLPKNDAKDQDRNNDVQHLHEEIARGETIFATIGGMKAQRGFKAWFMGRTDHFSFEIVAHKKKIAFYIATPRDMSLYIEKQIQAH